MTSNVNRHPKAIGLCSVVPQSGKSSVAHILQSEWGWQRLSIATPLKEMTETLLRYAAPTRDMNEMMRGPLKDFTLPELGVSPRRVMQVLGLDFRNLIKPTLWTDAAREKANDFMSQGYSVVFDDVRTKEDYDMIHALGGKVVQVQRPQAQIVQTTAQHPVENQLNDCQMDDVILNDRQDLWGLSQVVYDKMFEWYGSKGDQ